MSNTSTNSTALQSAAETATHLLDDWFDPIEAGLRDRVREFIQIMIEGELDAALSRLRYARRPKEASENADGASGITGHRHGHRSRSLLGTFGRVEIAVPRARLATAEGKTTEWKSTALRAYQRRTKPADALIAGAYLAGHQYPTGASGAVSGLRRRGEQGHGEPGVAERSRAIGTPGMPARWLRNRSSA